MNSSGTPVEITSDDYWFKIVDFLQQNWAVIEAQGESVLVRFIGDTSGVFDEMQFASVAEAAAGLQRNGFKRFSEDQKAQAFLRPPTPPFHRAAHPNGRIYSTGHFWV